MVYSRTIRGHKYLYRSVRKGEKVISEYVGLFLPVCRRKKTSRSQRCKVCGKLLIADKAIYYDAKHNREKKWMRDMKLMGIQPRIGLNLSFS